MDHFFNFVLVSRKDGDALRIRSEIERNKLYRMETMETGQECLERLRRGGIHCIVFNFDAFNPEKLRLVMTLREVGFNYPVIIFANFIDRDSLETIYKLNRVVVIEKPFESKDVWGICEKMLQGRKVNQRVYRRYNTDQLAAVEKTSTGETLDGRIFNLSRGGAYMELGSGAVAPGDLVRLCIPLDKLARNYNVDAEVVWCTTQQNGAGKRRAGLRFVRAGDVYRNLLHKL